LDCASAYCWIQHALDVGLKYGLSVFYKIQNLPDVKVRQVL